VLLSLGADSDSYWYFHQGTTRAFSTMGTAPFAVFAAMFPPIALFYASQARDNFKRWLFTAIAFVFVLGVILTLVRTGWVAVSAGLISYSLLTRRYWVVILLVVCAVILATVATGYTQYKVEGMLNPTEDLSVQNRIQIARNVSEAIVFRVFGYGLGTFAHNRFGRAEHFKDKTGYGISTENFYLMLILEMGWVGFLCFVWMLYKIYTIGWRQWKTLKTSRYRELSIGLLCSLFALDVARNGGPTGYYPPEAWQYWFFAALLMLIPKFDEELADEQAELHEVEDHQVAS
jgi:O-antigen ligase